MRVLLEDGTRLLANFRYNMKPQDAERVQKMGGEGYNHPTEEFEAKSADSVCGETMVGFAQNAFGQAGGSITNHRVQCIHGVQTKKEKLPF